MYNDVNQVIQKGYVDSLFGSINSSVYRLVTESYSNTQIDNLLSLYRLAADSYTKTEVDDIVANIVVGDPSMIVAGTNSVIASAASNTIIASVNNEQALNIETTGVFVLNRPMRLIGSAATNIT